MIMFKRWLPAALAFLLVASPYGSVAKAVQDQGFINPPDHYKASVFGDLGGQNSITAENFEIDTNDDGTLYMRSSNNQGKIASNSEGIAYTYKQISESSNFNLSTTVTVEDWTPNNQVSFGIMVRDEILKNENDEHFTGDYLAVGALDQEMKGFYNKNDRSSIEKDHWSFDDSDPPHGNKEYSLALIKSGDVYQLSVNGEHQIVEDFDAALSYGGFFTARNTAVTFSEYKVDVLSDEADGASLVVDDQRVKKEYLKGEDLNLEGLRVHVESANGSERRVNEDEWIVTGYDPQETGDQQINIHYNGLTEEIEVTVHPLSVTDLTVEYAPAKSTYYVGDILNTDGLEIEAEYNDGYKHGPLEHTEVSFQIQGKTVHPGEVLTSPGEKTVWVVSDDYFRALDSFTIDIRDEAITELEIRQAPVKTSYFIGEEFEPAGTMVYAHYEDGEEVRIGLQEVEIDDENTDHIGRKTVEISYKGEVASFDIEVKEPEVTHIEIVEYPKTTYEIGQPFDPNGLEVVYAYDNGDQTTVEEETLSLDISEYDESEPGRYEIVIEANGKAFEAIKLPVIVQNPREHLWESIVFGQSIGEDTNSIKEHEGGNIELYAHGNAGKVTQDHDGISYYYTELNAEGDNFDLSADIEVIEYAKAPHDGQESFGIMARDAIGPAWDSSVFSSNVATVGGFSGGTSEANGTQLYVRSGVISPDGEGSEGIQKNMIQEERPGSSNTFPAMEYRLQLTKTNSGFKGSLNGENETIIFEPDILNVQDDKMYVGFFVAREATINVHNIDLSVTDANVDPPKVDPPSEPVEPTLNIVSLERTSDTETYHVKAESNTEGTLRLIQEGQVIEEEGKMSPGVVLPIHAPLNDNEQTRFTAVFIPDDSKNLSNDQPIIKNFTVINRTFQDEIHVTPEGHHTGEGTRNDPVDVDTAIDFVSRGQTILLHDGHYIRDEKLNIRKYNDGAEGEMKTLKAKKGSHPVIDFNSVSEGAVLSGDYWHIEGIDFARSAGNTKGFVIGGSHNIVENSRFYENGDTGLQISRTDPSEDDISMWPSHNLVLNSTSFDNRDPAENNADGFAAKLTSGEGNVFRGAIAHNNIDDGFDLYAKVGTGAIGAVVIEDSIAYRNGTLTNGSAGGGDKNGFKLGGEGIYVPHIIRNSIAFENGSTGFTSNSNPGLIAENNIAFNNEGGNLDMSTYTNIQEDFELDRFISYHTRPAPRDRYPYRLESNSNYLFDGDVSENKKSIQINEQHFKSLHPQLPYKRDENGDIIWGDFLYWIPPAI
ncbi:bacterial Ig-like domain-containing protein [Geomicrobium sp. JSM 1781026]|uniref:bacterial Ig-like domain-containing protein n=1 Tax=Geomicrobium sp. JSM 1781026 TaxID=3344580 RepID=UPI0035BF2FF8